MKPHMKANDSLFFVSTGFCIFIHLETSREDVSVLSLAHHTLKKKKVSGFNTLIERGMWTACQGSEDAASWSHGWHRDSQWRSAYGIHHHLSLCTKRKKRKKIWASKQTSPPTPTPTHPPWDWQLWVATAGIVTAILAPRSRHWNTLFLSQEETGDPANSVTNCLGLAHIPNSPLQ